MIWRITTIIGAVVCMFFTVVAPMPMMADADEPANGNVAENARWEWVFVYYMSYDNNLDRCGRPILDMLKNGITSERVAVVVVADFIDRDGMQRFELTKGNETQTVLTTEASADATVLASQLAWVRENYVAKKYAVVFLNHGGALAEMCLDEFPGRRNGPRWLFLPAVAEVLTAWRSTLPGALELVFLQQCGKGTLENYFQMRTTAPFVMASQTVVGAPNYYYTDALRAICATPDLDGRQVAKLFQTHETATMFTTYTTIDTAQIAQLPEKLDAVLHPLLAIDGPIRGPDGGANDGDRQSGQLVGGRVASIEITFAESGIRTLTTESDLDLMMVLKDARGRTIAHDDDSGQGYNPLISRPFTAGTYRIEILGYDETVAGDFILVVRDGEAMRTCFDMGAEERFFDGLIWLRALYRANGLDEAPLDTFAEWVKTQLVVEHRVSPRHQIRAGNWCGFSIYCPAVPRAVSRYRAHYAIYSATKLADLHARLLAPRRSAEPAERR